MIDTENEIQKSAPEFSYYHKVKAFFEGDPDIIVDDINEFSYEFTIYVKDKKKCDILRNMLCIPSSARRLIVNIEYDGGEEKFGEEDLAYLLSGNKHFSRYEDGSKNGLIPATMRYILMKPEAVQYYDDIFNNPMGFDTKTAEQLAKELFHGNHCNITSDVV